MSDQADYLLNGEQIDADFDNEDDLFIYKINKTVRTIPDGMIEMKNLSDGTVIDSSARKYLKAEDGSLRRIKI